MKTLLVVVHPRRNSLTFAAAEAFAQEAQRRGAEIEWADLATEGFEPVMGPADEPDWADPRKAYSPAVQREMARVERNEATVMFFPIWWWSMPALLKGWVDRVWNHGWAYGDRKHPHRRAWMVALAGVGAEAYSKRRYDEAMRIQLDVGILDFCGIAERRLEILYGATEGAEQAGAILASAAALGREF